ncbi:MAG: hypothetical protein ACOC0O_06575 [Spirochaetota bacterium]
MRPDEVLARRVAREIETELESIERLSGELAHAPDSDDTFALRARGSIIHDFYTGVERVFVRLAEEVNGGVPHGDHWHRQLLHDMEIEIPDVRPAVISAALAHDLDEFLRFRYVFRNVYGFVLQPDRLRALQAKLPTVLARFLAEVRRFLAWLSGR